MFSRTLIKRYRLGAAGALTGGALAVFAAAAGYAQTDEIQVYDAEINQPGRFSLQLHNNYTRSAVSSRILREVLRRAIR